MIVGLLNVHSFVFVPLVVPYWQHEDASRQTKNVSYLSGDRGVRYIPRWEGGGGGCYVAVCNPESELRLGGRQKKKGGDSKRDGKTTEGMVQRRGGMVAKDGRRLRR